MGQKCEPTRRPHLLSTAQKEAPPLYQSYLIWQKNQMGACGEPGEARGANGCPSLRGVVRTEARKDRIIVHVAAQGLFAFSPIFGLMGILAMTIHEYALPASIYEGFNCQ
ncbi:UPF0271 protein CGSHiEE_03400 [Striga asiatica]|uniref:UPF0271 protein CGSHiEE_03400 n=1 Tax=Striga asiatica TaxID=4170 RepID=A0A5A7QEP4_STRAF|nr:UPF0271 protein CGSHiEE_03400 [Striga asiatica]